MKYDELQEDKKLWGGSDKHYVYYRKNYRKSYGSAVLRHRPVALLVNVGWRQDGVIGTQEPIGVFFTQQMKDIEQLTLFISLMQTYGILHCDVILILALPGSFRMEFWC